MDKEVSHSTRHYRKRVADGLCPYCGEPTDGGVRCNKCKEKEKQKRKEAREWYLSKGICPYCRTENVEPNRTRCFECLEKERIRKHNDAYKNREEFLAKNREYQRERYRKRKEEGICTMCQNKATPGYSTCRTCRIQKIRPKKKKVEEKRTDRWKRGVCYFCEEPLKEGYKICQKHWEECFERSKKCPQETRRQITNRIFGRSDFK